MSSTLPFSPRSESEWRFQFPIRLSEASCLVAPGAVQLGSKCIECHLLWNAKRSDRHRYICNERKLTFCRKQKDFIHVLNQSTKLLSCLKYLLNTTNLWKQRETDEFWFRLVRALAKNNRLRALACNYYTLSISHYENSWSELIQHFKNSNIHKN